MKKSLVIGILLCLARLSGFAQVYQADTVTVCIGFRRGVSAIEPGYGDNARMTSQLVDYINGINADTTTIIHSIYVNTSASPEGSKANNDRLSKARARSILDYLFDNTTLSPSQIKVNSRGENWEELEMFLRESCTESWRDAALLIIRESGVLASDDEKVAAGCKARLQALAGGAAWDWMDRMVFPALRNAGGRIYFITSPVAAYSGMDRDEVMSLIRRELVTRRDTVFMYATYVPVEMSDSDKDRHVFRKDSLFRIPVMAFRSNLLLPLLNVGAEFPLGNRSSVGLDYCYPWLMRDWVNSVFPAQQKCFQCLCGALEYRIWLGKSHSKTADPKYRLRGHSLGLSAVGGYYDLENDWKGEQGEFYGLAADYRYALPLGKGACHFEFHVGAGYAVNPFRVYDVHTEGGKLVGNRFNYQRHFAFPRLGFSLVVPITRKEVVR